MKHKRSTNLARKSDRKVGTLLLAFLRSRMERRPRIEEGSRRGIDDRRREEVELADRSEQGSGRSLEGERVKDFEPRSHPRRRRENLDTDA